jgi:2-methylisocitrate lyase-like PEP mutase family enzyme
MIRRGLFHITQGFSAMTRKTLKTYDVTYIVTLPMTYRIKAANLEQAEELAQEDGEFIGYGDTIDYRHHETTLA